MTDTPAIDRARSDIDQLVTNCDIIPRMGRRAHALVDHLFDGDTVYATISPIDGDDVSFYWRAGELSVSIILESGDPPQDWARWRTGSNDWEVVTICGGLRQGALRDALRRFSAHVQVVNPNWREMNR